MSYVTGKLIKELREKNRLQVLRSLLFLQTQKQQKPTENTGLLCCFVLTRRGRRGIIQIQIGAKTI